VQHSGAWNGGVLSTAGNLVFQGTADGNIVAFTADTGERLWSFPTQTGVVAPPISYQIDGEQYISVNAGWGGAFALVLGEFVQKESLPNVSRVLTFKLGASETLPEVDWEPVVVFDPPEQTAGEADLLVGFAAYQDNCVTCHGLNAVSGLLVPDLRATPLLHDAEAWDAVVLDGARAANGMPPFGTLLSEDESRQLRSYVIQQAWRGLDLQRAAGEDEAAPTSD
jgi:mono/diheme cytochrome c family protein